jgi:hypothetical protein
MNINNINDDYSIKHWETLPTLPNEAEVKETQAVVGYTPVKVNNSDLQKANSNGRTFVIYKKDENPALERYGMRLAGLLSILTVVPGILLLVNKLCKGTWMDQLINGASTTKYYKKEIPKESTASKANQVATGSQRSDTAPKLKDSEIVHLLVTREDNDDGTMYLRSDYSSSQALAAYNANKDTGRPHLPFYMEGGVLKAVIYKKGSSVKIGGLKVDNCEITKVAKTKEDIEDVIERFKERT